MAADFLNAATTHGGRLAAAEAAFPDASRPWLDLSTGINPRSWRGARAPAAALRRLPDPEAVAALEAAAAQAFGTEPERVAATPGTEIALRLLPRLLGARRVGVVSPTYGGHEAAARAAGAAISRISLAEIESGDFDAAVVVNPNNPDGALASPDRLQAAAAGRWLIVDEAFAEVAPQVSVAAVAIDRLVVLRSFGKFYGLPGARLGFVVAAPAVAGKVREALGDWPLSADALALGYGAYLDHHWREDAARRLAADSERFDRLLTRAGFSIVGGTSLFRLVAAPDAPARFESLCAAGVLTRPFAHEPSWLRFGLPPAGSWSRLASALIGAVG